MARKTRQLSIKECYDILQLQKGADLQAVKSAYRKRAFELHPDLNPGNMEANDQFRLLNEAYVALSAMLKPVEEAKQKAEKQKQDNTREESSESTQTKKETGPQGDSESKTAESSRARQAYAEQDVLRDLLDDPFARRVFEDIYSELAKKQTGGNRERKTDDVTPPKNNSTETKTFERPKTQTQKAKPIPLWEKGTEKGFKGAVKDWFRKQIDEELHLTFPASRLAPGKKIPLTVSYGLKNETQTVEVTIPPNFVAGKPMRLKGLGKRLGPWQGDLYLTIHTV